MNDRFTYLLKEFLDSECEDFGIDYKLEFDGEDCCDVTLTGYETEVDLKFKYNKKRDSIAICLYEDTFETVRYFDWTVRYFWMKAAPYMFPV